MMEYYSAIKRMKFCHLQQHGWTWGALLSEIRQRERQILYDTSLLCGTPPKIQQNSDYWWDEYVTKFKFCIQNVVS